jgi:Fe2+ transport system protein FeoA
MKPLFFACAGEECKVEKINGSTEIKQRLGGMGMTVGCFLTVISADRGDVIVRVGQTRIALSGKTAQRIIV